MEVLTKVLGTTGIIFDEDDNITEMVMISNSTNLYYIDDGYALYTTGDYTTILLMKGNKLIKHYKMSDNDLYVVTMNNDNVMLEKHFIEDFGNYTKYIKKLFTFEEVEKFNDATIPTKLLNDIMNQKDLVKESLFKGTHPHSKDCVYWEVTLENGRTINLFVKKEEEE